MSPPEIRISEEDVPPGRETIRSKGRITQTLGLFFLGILIGRTRLFYDEGNHLKIWRKVLYISLASAVVIYLAGPIFGIFAVITPGMTLPHLNLAILLIIVSGVVLLWYRFAGFRRSLAHICFFGRMSLTNYLMSSLFGSFIFYGWGLGMYKVLGTTWSLLVGIAIVVLQIVLLRQWAKTHQRGPLESLWRHLTWLGA